MVVQTARGDPVQILREVGALLEGDFLLASGKRSTYYLDSKMLTLHPDGARLVGSYFFEKVRGSGVQAVGGMAVGAIPIVEAVVLTSQLEGHPLPGFFVRKEAKVHGTEKVIEGHLPSDKTAPVAIIDDVVTKGKSILNAIGAVEAEGNPISRVMCVLDRGEGGKEALKARGYDLEAMFTVVGEEGGKPIIKANE